MRLLVSKSQMKNAGPILVEQLGEFLNCTDEEMQILLDGPMNPLYHETLENINIITHDDRLLIFSPKGIHITVSDEEFNRYKMIYCD